MAAATQEQTANRNGPLLTIAVSIVVGLLWAWAGSQGSAELGGVAVFAIAIALAFAINWLAFVPSYIAGTEHYYDLVGSLTYLSVTIFTLLVTER
jgi:hypothetical protein